jgi:hypothetical protein
MDDAKAPASTTPDASALAEREWCVIFLEKQAAQYEQMVTEGHADQPKHAASLAKELRRVARVFRSGVHAKPG